MAIDRHPDRCSRGHSPEVAGRPWCDDLRPRRYISAVLCAWNDRFQRSVLHPRHQVERRPVPGLRLDTLDRGPDRLAAPPGLAVDHAGPAVCGDVLTAHPWLLA